MVRPYEHKGTTRLFSGNVDEHELVWHRDKRDRHVRVESGEGWWFQFDNEMPVRLNRGDEIHIPAMVYHRILKGTSPLRLSIEEL